MKTLNQPVWRNTFLTKKKLSNSSHIHWIIALMIAIGLGYLFILIEFVKMYDRKILFYNLKIANVEEGASVENVTAISFKKTSPLFLIYEDKVIFGTVESILLPNLKQDSLVLNKNNFLEEFKEKIKSYKNYKFIFPSQVYGISFVPKENEDNYSKKLDIMNQIYTAVQSENIKNDSRFANPSVIFVEAQSKL